MVIPISQQKEGVLEEAKKIQDILKSIDIRTKMDDSEKSPGFKFSEQEMLGIPIRIEIGPKDIEKEEVIVVTRNKREKITVKIKDLKKKIPKILEKIQQEMYESAQSFLENHIEEATTLEEMKKISKNKTGFIKAMWCGKKECEEGIKAITEGYGSRCIPKEQSFLSNNCIYCGDKAKHLVIWGKSY